MAVCAPVLDVYIHRACNARFVASRSAPAVQPVPGVTGPRAAGNANTAYSSSYACAVVAVAPVVREVAAPGLSVCWVTSSGEASTSSKSSAWISQRFLVPLLMLTVMVSPTCRAVVTRARKMMQASVTFPDPPADTSIV